MKRFAGVLLLIALPCLVAACGRTSHRIDRSSGPLSRAAQLNPTKATSSGPAPPSPAIAGDYDADDEYQAQGASDKDNDDKTESRDWDKDEDSSGKGYYDVDDRSVRLFGPAASRSDATAIGRLLRLYYRAAVAGNGAAACSLMTPVLAKSLPGALGGSSGPPYARGGTCAAVASTVFAHYHRQLAAHAITLTLGDVRINRSQGEVVLAFKGLPGRQIDVVREAGAWKVREILDRELP